MAMVETRNIVYERGGDEPALYIVEISDASQVSSEIALGVAQVLAQAYRSSPGICERVPYGTIYDHFLPLNNKKQVVAEAIEARRKKMQTKITDEHVSYWLASDADVPERLTGIAKTNPSHASPLQKLRKRLHQPAPSLFVAEAVEVQDANQAVIGLLHAVITRGGYDQRRQFVMDVYKADAEQNRLAMRYLGLQALEEGSSYQIGPNILASTRFGKRSIQTVQAKLEAHTAWLNPLSAEEQKKATVKANMSWSKREI